MAVAGEIRGQPAAAVVAEDIAHSFGARVALDGVGLAVAAGSIHALLGPNGAGKTTLLRVLCGLLTPQQGTVRFLGVESPSRRDGRRAIGLVPSGDRTFYLRISGLENLVFFARLHGMPRREATRRAAALLGEVGLGDVAKMPVAAYSHGMQKRLSFARALLADPSILLIDEATHDLDPEGARRVRGLAAAAADRGVAVVWATQRLDEIRGLAAQVTLLGSGRVRFEGSVPELMAQVTPRRYLLRLRNGAAVPASLAEAGEAALGALGTLEPAGEPGEHYLLALAADAVLGEAVAALARAEINVLTCREERSEIEEAFLTLAGSSQ